MKKTPMFTLKLFKGKNGKIYWKIKAQNGNIIASSSQGFYNHTGARRNLYALKRALGAFKLKPCR